jgi:ribonuclease HI
MQVLKRRHIEKVSFCKFCGNHEETAQHAMMECPNVISFWKTITKITGVKLPTLHPHTWASDVISGRVCSQRDGEIITCGAYALWNNRNKATKGESGLPTKKLVSWIQSVVDETCNLASQSPNKSLPAQQWKPPPSSMVTVNSDGAFFPQESTGAGGAVIRVSNGKFLGAHARWYGLITSPLVAEAIACMEGLEFALNQGYSSIVLETDSQELLNLWHMRDEQRSEIMGTLQRIKELCERAVKFSFVHVPRHCNAAAHLCAKQPSSTRVSCVWLGDPPNFIVSCLQQDCNFMVKY